MSAKTTQEDTEVDAATQELFTMADTIRDDGYYDVPITGWEKDGDMVHVYFETPIDGTHSNKYYWPSKPTEDRAFVQVLMAALDLDDPIAAVSRADSLKQPDGDALRSTVPCDSGSEWKLKPSAAGVHNNTTDDEGRANQTGVGYMWMAAITAPAMVLWFILHGFFGWEEQRRSNNKHDTAKVAAATMFGMALYTGIPLLLYLLATL